MNEKSTLPYPQEDDGIRNFHIGDILSITTGRLLSERHVEGVYDILNYMTDDNLYTHQLPRGIKECAPALRQQLPELGQIEVPAFEDVERVYSWLGKIALEYGETHPVSPLLPEEHTVINPIDELFMMDPAAITLTIEPPQD